VANFQADSSSEYVALEKLEGVYALDPLFASFLVHGDSTRSSLVAIGVLDPEKALALVEKITGRKITSADFGLLEDAIQDERVRKAVVEGLGKVARRYKLNGYVGKS
jgi:long-chain acyl-CoA synthetase